MHDETKPSLLQCTQNIIKLYERRELKVTGINVDNQFKCIENDIPCAMENVTRGDHVGDVERSIRTQEEHTRVLVHRVPFRAFPRVMVDSAAVFPSMIRNAFISDTHGLSTHISPRTFVTGLGNL